jgi:hypothetical protein
MDKDKKNPDLKLEAFLARESARRKRAAALNKSPKTVDEQHERVMEAERIRRSTEEKEDPKKR